jgi:hypothetical protein
MVVRTQHRPKPQPGPLDLVGVKARGAYSCAQRLSLSYRGPLITVRRASDNATQDINAIALTGKLNREQLKAFCSGTSGFVTKAWDLTGNAKHLTAPTTAAQPRIVNAGVIDVNANGRPVMVFDGVDDELSRTDALGLTGSPALTIGMCWSASSNQKDPWSLGETTGGSDARVSTYTDNARSNTSVLWNQGAQGRDFTLGTAATAFNAYTAMRGAAATAHDSSVVLRQNGAALTWTANEGSNNALNLVNAYTAIGRTTWTFVASKWNFFAVVNAVLSGNALTAFEAGEAAHV